MFSPRNREMAVVPNSLWRTRLPNQNAPWDYVSRRFLKKGRGPELGFIWNPNRKDHSVESCPEKTNPTTSKTGMHSIESSIAAEAKITQLTRRLELLEVREQNSVKQINPPQMPNSGCTYCHALTHIFWGMSCITSSTDVIWWYECSLYQIKFQFLLQEI